MAADLNDPAVLATLAANVATVIALIFLAFQIRSQGSDAKYTAYEKLMSDFTETTLKLVEQPGISGILYPRSWTASKDQKDLQEAYWYSEALLGLFERVWIAQKKFKRANIEWSEWSIWINELGKSPVFQKVVAENLKYYDSDFMDEVQRLLESGH